MTGLAAPVFLLTLIACIPSVSDEPTGEEVVVVSMSDQQANEEIASTPLPGERQSEDGSYTSSKLDATKQATEWMEGLPDPVPEEPPVAQIVSADSNGEVIAVGIPYYVNWDTSRNLPSPDLPILPWPEPVVLGKERFLRFLTGSRTHMVIVTGIDRVDPDTYWPIAGEKAESYECTRSDRNPCERITPDGFVEYHRIPPEVLLSPYVSVFAMWIVPPNREGDRLIGGGNSVMSNWTFRLADN